MKFSIIIPVYNVEQYVEECINSVLNQTYQNMEIILIDDGSTDCSGKICDQYFERYPHKVKTFHQKNQGPHIARMCGIENADGDIVLFVDADDAIRIDALEVLKKQFEQTACDVLLFQASQKEDFSAPCFVFPFEDGQCFCGESKKKLYKALILNSNMNSLCLKAIRTEVLLNIPESYKAFQGCHGEDLLLSLPLLTGAKKIGFINQNLYYYRMRSESIVHTYNPERHRSVKLVHMEMEKYIDLWGMEEYHAVHYAREVRGWVECLKMILVNTKKLDMQLIKELEDDTYFRNAYTRMERRILSGKDALLGAWLYQKKNHHIMLAGMVLRWIRTLKQLLKGSKKL